MSVRIYVEGGGDNKDTLKRCTEGFGAYCSKLAPANKKPRIVACGGRDQAFGRFKTAIEVAQAGEICILLVDSEAEVTTRDAVAHLRSRDRWQFPRLEAHQVFLMVQAMEAWFLADRSALNAYYGIGFLDRSLPGSPANIEVISKDDLESALKHASRQTKTKGEYHKVMHGFALLAIIDPSFVENASAHAKQFHDFLRAL